MAAASLERKGFHTRYSVLVGAGVLPFSAAGVDPLEGRSLLSIEIRFSPYTASPGAWLRVTCSN